MYSYMDITDKVTFEKNVVLIVLCLVIHQQYVEEFLIFSNTYTTLYTRDVSKATAYFLR
jgi:hypothetical protein